MAYDNVYFDLDGTLTASAPGLINAFRYTLEKLSLPPADDDFLCTFIGPPIEESFNKHYGFDHAQSMEAVRIFREYYNDKAHTDEAWHDGLYHTGDMAWMDEDGYCIFVGRTDDLIKSSGYRIGPFEVESCLMEHPAVTECAITAVPDPIRGQAVKATIKLSKGYAPSPELIKELQDYVKHHTAPYKYPRVVEFVDELPKTISGKIRRVQIREEDK